MFNPIETDQLLKSVCESRFSGSGCNDAVLDGLLEQCDFGQNFFHRILSKSILKPGSIASDTVASMPLQQNAS